MKYPIIILTLLGSVFAGIAITGTTLGTIGAACIALAWLRIVCPWMMK